ncbi:flagellar biosynthesis protein FlhB [uncultured Leclercia sp.]|uniref:flagellar biosynthesis protein FlhB n=1 Tax=uncultured Leclercia sp. TaxID=332959 RepID=UPI002599A43D|nr:flagellar biosynthesis protein FlhB [uncultured Leclercia sp.]
MSGSSGEKSEKATQGKLRKAREKGDVARSKDLTMAAGLITSLAVISLFFPFYQTLVQDAFHSMAVMGEKLNDDAALENFLLHQVWLLLKFILTLTPIPVACIVASLVPGRWVFTPNKLVPDLKKLSPVSGFKRMFSASHYVEVLKMLLKCGVLMAVLWSLIQDNLGALMALQRLWLVQGIHEGLALLLHAFWWLLGIILIFAFIDVPLSLFMFMKKMRMTKQEVREEHKQNDGNPQIKGRIRQLQQQFALGQINSVVPTADVIITNPTHFAVALKYDPAKAQAPYVIAKGVDDMALHIRDVAARHQVEVVEFPPLARAIYHSTRINQQIPATLFRAIAHVLTYVIQIKAWRSGQSDVRPKLNNYMEIPQEVMKHNG